LNILTKHLKEGTKARHSNTQSEGDLRRLEIAERKPQYFII